LFGVIDAIVAEVRRLCRPDYEWYEVYIRERTHFNISQTRNSQNARTMRRRRMEAAGLIEPTIRHTRQARAQAQDASRPLHLVEEDEPYAPGSWAEILADTKRAKHIGSSEREIVETASAWALTHFRQNTELPLPSGIPDDLRDLIERERKDRNEAESNMF